MAKNRRIDGDLLMDTLAQRHACWKRREEEAKGRVDHRKVDWRIQLEEVERCRDRAAECAFIMAIVDDFRDGWRERLAKEKREAK